MAQDKMYYSEVGASEYLRLALGLMVKYKSVATPINYTVWYEYVSGTNIVLKNLIDDFIEKNTVFTSELLQKVFIQHVNGGIDGITNHSIMAAIERVVSMVSEHIGETSEREKNLENCADLLNDNLDVSNIKNIVSTIIKETKAVISSGEYLENGIAKANKEIVSLRKQLAESEADAQTDALTGLSNRRAMDIVLNKHIGFARESNKGLCVMMADIDHFKKVNDTYGHLVGDNVLKIFASTLTDFVKGRDKVIRYGGEEFLIILPETPLKGAQMLAEKIRSTLENKNWERKETGTNMGKITISIGISKYKDSESLEAFVKRADQALYASKNNGRNQVTTDEQLLSGNSYRL